MTYVHVPAYFVDGEEVNQNVAYGIFKERFGDVPEIVKASIWMEAEDGEEDDIARLLSVGIMLAV